MKTNKPAAIPHFDRTKCWACTMCISACPVGALGLAVRNGAGGFRRYPYISNIRQCLVCYECENECPAGAVKLVRPAVDSSGFG